jgi:hypothetical protein
MQKGHVALAMQLGTELRGLSTAEVPDYYDRTSTPLVPPPRSPSLLARSVCVVRQLRSLMRHKHRTLWALQTYGASNFGGQATAANRT